MEIPFTLIPLLTTLLLRVEIEAPFFIRRSNCTRRHRIHGVQNAYRAMLALALLDMRHSRCFAVKSSLAAVNLSTTTSHRSIKSTNPFSNAS